MDVRYISSLGYNLFDKFESSFGGKGSITLEPGWQLCAIPIKNGYWSVDIHKHVHTNSVEAKIKNYVIDQIDDLYGPGLIEVANTYIGDVQAFYSFIPGVTPSTSSHNFKLVNEDDGFDEISGFWIKSIHTEPISINWGE